MIQLHRGVIPPSLKRNARRETLLLWKAWRSGKKLNIKASIYAHVEVKRALKKTQHGKCAYCESLNPRSHDVVEHYRPKRGHRQTERDTLQEPGYFWLAYKWENLLFACDMCNDGGHKQNLFPLKNPEARAAANNPSTSAEIALLINPYDEDPSEHIGWNSDVPFAKDGSEKGEATIRVFGLDRDQTLIDARREHFNIIDSLLTVFSELPVSNPKRKRIRKLLLSLLNEANAYAAMTRANFYAQIMEAQ